LDVRLLGPVEVTADGRPLELGGPQPRALLAHLALDHGRVVSVERLVVRLWGEQPPASPLASLQTTLSRLRRVLEPDRAPGTPPAVIASEPPGYVLHVPADAVDLMRFRALTLDGRRAAAAALHSEARQRFEAALGEWRGPPLGGVGPDDVIAPIALALDEERLAVVQDRFDVLLALGLHVEAVAELSVAVSDHPLKEGLWSALAIALYRSQRQADALRAIDQARRTLIDELGLDPGPGLRELERRILDHDPSLLAVPLPSAPVAPAAPQPRAAIARFVGRTTEWSSLVGALARAAHGDPQLVLLEGDAGIGKSAIAERLLEHAADRGWRTAVGRGVDGDLAPALWPIIELVRAMGGDLAGFGAGEGATVRTAVEIADQVLAVIDREASGAGWCLLLDDLHWADRLTLEVLALLAERLRDRRVMVVGAFRPVATVPDSPLHDVIGALNRVPGGERLVLPPLGEDDVAEIVRRMTGSSPTPDAVRLVYDRAGGNPFFVGELARLIGEGGIPSDFGVPDAVRDVVRARLAPLPPITKSVLQVAAVAGERLDLPVVIAANGLDDEACLDALDPAIVSRMLVAESMQEVRFAHALVREAVLADIAPLQVVRLHRAVAEAIERTRGTGIDVIETIARHRLAALPLGDAMLTAEQLLRAADVARWRGAFESADELAELAIGVVRELPPSPQVETLELRGLEGITVTRGRRFGGPAEPDMARRIEALARRTGSDAARVLALYVRWWEIDVDPVAHYRDLADAALATAETTTSAYAKILGHHVAGFQAYMEGRLDDAARYVEAGVSAAGQADPDDDPGYVPPVHLPAIAAIVAQLRGDDATAHTHAVVRYAAWFRVKSSVDPTTSIDHGFTMAIVTAMRGDAAATRRALLDVDLTEIPVWARHLGHGCEVLEGWSAAVLGDADGPRRAMQALERLEPVSTQVLRSCQRTFAGAALLNYDDPAAVAVLERAHREAVERGEVWWLAETLRIRAHAERRFGDAALARKLIDEARHIAAQQGAQLLVDRLAADGG
jgi:DNA-binding SARP family transcriptional activator